MNRSQVTSSVRPAHSEDLPGGRTEPLVIGRYEIHREIARGGMAAVHLARLVGARGFSRAVAVKRALPHLVRDPDFVEMFLDEVRIASRIQHTNVVSTIDVLKSGEELILVMDYVHGESLARLMQATAHLGGGLPAPLAAAIVLDALNGLHAAHEATDERGRPLHVVHRDVSPANILVGQDGIARLADFGIAKAAGRVHMTRDCSVKGKFAYMAPEQVRGEPVTRRTDVYAASVVLWELLTGKRLFLGRTHAETVQRALFEPIPRVITYAPSVGAELDAVVMKGLCRDPEGRYQTAREMVRDLEACVPGIHRSEVGLWVENMARSTLAARAALIVAIEGDRAGRLDAEDDAADVTLIRPIDETLRDSCRPEAPACRQEAPDGAKEERAGAEDAVDIARLRARPRAPLVASLLGALLLVGGLLAPSPGSSKRQSPRAAPATTTAATNGAPATNDAPATEPAATSAEVPSAPAVRTAVFRPIAPTDATDATDATETGVTAPAPAPRNPDPQASATKRAACDPPYSVDALGRTHFKVECL